MDHVRELQGRLFAVVIVFVVVSAAAYPFFDKIVNFILAPLGSDHELVYLTPGGAFSFIIQACMYVGLIGALPAIVYNVYRFIMPAMNNNTLNRALVFTVASLLLAIGGMLFAYYVSLPAALYFLTSFDLYHINPMLTIDSYFSFVMTYMLAGALLFQIPLIMLMINGATPLKPKKLMHYQDKIILGSFIVAAIISPTPDALNQALLASPMIVMYQAGIILVWLRNRKGRRGSIESSPTRAEVTALRTHKPPLAAVGYAPSIVTTSKVSAVNSTPKDPRPQYGSHATRSIDGFIGYRGVPRRPIPQLERKDTTLVKRQIDTSKRLATRQIVRSLDGFIVS